MLIPTDHAGVRQLLSSLDGQVPQAFTDYARWPRAQSTAIVLSMDPGGGEPSKLEQARRLVLAGQRDLLTENQVLALEAVEAAVAQVSVREGVVA